MKTWMVYLSCDGHIGLPLPYHYLKLLVPNMHYRELSTVDPHS